MVCVESCPRDAIKIVDSLRNYNAVIKEDKFIECNLCHSACQADNKIDFLKPCVWKQGWVSNDSIRKHTSSDGLAALMHMFVEERGVVCNYTFHQDMFIFDFADDCDDLKCFVGLKYPQSANINKHNLVNNIDNDKI